MSLPLTSLLECPSCRSGTLDEQGAVLSCGNCDDGFPLQDGIGRFLRLSNEYTENYDQICADDLMEPKTPTVVKRTLTDLVQDRASGVTCDIGCGDGYAITRVDVKDRIAVDIAFDYLARLPSDMLRLWSAAEDIPLRDATIDTAICTDVFEHVLDAKRLAREITRIVRPGGKLLLASPFKQDLSVYDLPSYKEKYGKYKFVHLRSVDDAMVLSHFDQFDLRFEHLVTEGMRFMEFKPYPIKFWELVRKG